MVLWIIAGASPAFAQSSSFTYQGRLMDGGTAANGNYDLQFALWNSLSGGTQVGSTQTLNTVAVSNGVFTVSLDFGANAFPGATRFLEIGARPSGSGSFTPLTPRQPITSTPYAVRSLNASSADSVPASGVSAGSGNYIQNTSNPQASSNFNISSNGTAGGTLAGNAVNATTQYNLNGSRMLSAPGNLNLFVGGGAGVSNTTGFRNAFFGSNAGAANVNGDNNAFFGEGAGQSNTSGNFNAFFGGSAGLSNTAGQTDAFFGQSAGRSNTTGNDNSFFGFNAGTANTTGGSNAFFGSSAGQDNIIGQLNSYFGKFAGSRATGSLNTFIGTSADFDSNSPSGDKNTLLGANATIGTTPTFSPINATAIGANAKVDASNALVLGSINTVNGATGDTNVGIGTTAPQARLHIRANTGNILLGDAGCGSGFGAIGFGSSFSGCGNYALRGGDAHTYINRPTGGTIIFREGNSSNQVEIRPGGFVGIASLDSAGSTQLCRNAASAIANCSSSLRYKTEVKPFGGGLQLVNRLQPVRFAWKTNQQPDIGLIAEDVAQVEPLLTFKNQNGEIEGVNYSQVSVVLINAIKEQQAQIQQQRELIERQQALAGRQQQQLNALKQIVSRLHRRVRVRR